MYLDNDHLLKRVVEGCSLLMERQPCSNAAVRITEDDDDGKDENRTA
jgi:hypothetical protein